MSIFFMDSSALVKRYMPETGTIWIRGLVSRKAAHDIVIAQITPVEMISAMGRQLHDGQITLAVFQSLRQFVLHHTQTQYQVLTLSNAIVLQAIRLHESHRLRAYDSIQLGRCVGTANTPDRAWPNPDISLSGCAASCRGSPGGVVHRQSQYPPLTRLPSYEIDRPSTL